MNYNDRFALDVYHTAPFNLNENFEILGNLISVNENVKVANKEVNFIKKPNLKIPILLCFIDIFCWFLFIVKTPLFYSHLNFIFLFPATILLLYIYGFAYGYFRFMPDDLIDCAYQDLFNFKIEGRDW